MIFARQSTAIIVTVGPVLDASGVAVTDGVVADFKISKNGGAPAGLNASATLTHRHTGHYSLSLTATDVNTVGTAEIVIDDTVNACPMKEITVVEPATYDVLFADAAPGPASPTNITAGTVTTATNVTTVNGLAANVITATSIQNDAITAAKIADAAIDAATFAAGAITATVIATGAIDADALAADAVAEIADGVWDEDATGHQTQGTFGQAIGDPVADTNTIFKAVVTDAAGATVGVDIVAVKAETASIQVDTDDLQTKIGTPSNLGGGATVAANLSDIEAQTDDIGVAGAGLTAVPWNAAWDAEVQSEVDDALVAQNLDHLVKIAVDTDFATTVHLNSVVGHLADAGGTATFDRTTDALEVLGAATAPSAASIADAVWEEAIADHSGTVGSTAEQLAAAGAAGDPWATALPGAYGAGTAGKIIGDNINATISSRLAPTVAARTLDVSAGGEAGIDWANIGSPTTAQTLSGTTVKTATDVETDTQDIQARLPAALLNGRMEANVAAISDDATAANNLETMLDGTGGQVLSLKQLNIVNDSGSALVASATGGNGHGIAASGNGSGSGVASTAGATGHGVQALGGATSGHGLKTWASAGNSRGISAVGTGSGPGIEAYGGATGPGIYASSTDSGHGIIAEGGGTAGDGFVATANDGRGLSVSAGGAHEGMTIAGGTAGLSISAGDNGHGIEVYGGGTSGDGIHAEATDGDGIEAIGAGVGNADLKADLTGNITGSLSGSVGSLAAQAKADVNAEADTALVDVGLTTTITGRIDAAVSTRLASGTVASDVTAVKAKTDKLTFDADNALDANVQKINDVTLLGDGSATPWGPA
jgi:hypothetical protein